MKNLVLTVASVVLWAQSAFAGVTINAFHARQYPGVLTASANATSSGGNAMTAVVLLPSTATVTGTSVGGGTFVWTISGNQVVSGSNLHLTVTDNVTLETDHVVITCSPVPGGFYCPSVFLP